ncbi:hypothetical protein [Brevibacillus borstelensis]|uniref:hypothetical protein n=1 Tax=Brevibacillus borstelensis TaxID=45462 RepID=UPI0030BB9EE5
MKKILIPISAILIIYVISNLIYFPGFKVWSFDEIITFDKEKITSIYIRSNKKEVHVTDSSTISKIFDDFSKMEVSKRKRAADVQKSDSSSESKNSQKYFIEMENNGELVEMIYLSGNLFKIYGYSTDETVVYEIVNIPELDIPNIFSSAQN